MRRRFGKDAMWEPGASTGAGGFATAHRPSARTWNDDKDKDPTTTLDMKKAKVYREKSTDPQA